MTSGISASNQASAELPLSPRQGEVRWSRGTLARMARLNHTPALPQPAKTLAKRWVVAKRQNHHGIKSDKKKETMSAPFAGYFHLFSLKWKWDGSSVSLSKRRARIPRNAPIQTAMLQCIARHATCFYLTIEYYKVCLYRTKKTQFLVFTFFRRDRIIAQFAASTQQDTVFPLKVKQCY